jgi:hypothetical protein
MCLRILNFVFIGDVILRIIDVIKVHRNLDSMELVSC